MILVAVIVTLVAMGIMLCVVAAILNVLEWGSIDLADRIMHWGFLAFLLAVAAIFGSLVVAVWVEVLR
jgi:hypothetical protein